MININQGNTFIITKKNWFAYVLPIDMLYGIIRLKVLTNSPEIIMLTIKIEYIFLSKKTFSSWEKKRYSKTPTATNNAIMGDMII